MSQYMLSYRSLEYLMQMGDPEKPERRATVTFDSLRPYFEDSDKDIQ